jgi:tetratricopeptide (TPR) repeat protein
MKALDKDRNRRYETANGFAQDVQRYLADEPVQACPPSAWYRLRKFGLRNRAALTIAAVTMVALLLVGASAFWVLLDRAARQARETNDVELALDRADMFQRDGKGAEGRAVLAQAEELASRAPPDPTRAERLTRLKDQLAADARDQEFITRFDDIRLRAQSRVNVETNTFTQGAAFPEIQDALRRHGMEIGSMAPAEAAARIQARPDRVRRELIAALEECYRFAPRADPQVRRWLLGTLTAADNDAWRLRFRRALFDDNREVMDQLARTADVDTQPPSFLLFVADILPKSATRLQLLRRIQRANPTDLWANHALAHELFHDRKPAEAVRYYTAALALRKDSPGIYLNRGLAFFGAGEWDAAIADYHAAIRLNPNYIGAHFNLGVVLELKGEPDQAIAAYREAIRINKDYAGAHYNLGIVLQNKGELNQAIAAYREAIRINKDDAKAHGKLGGALREVGQLDEAIAACREAVRLKKDYAEGYHNLGFALNDKGQPDEAIAAFQESIKLKKDSAETYVSLGAALAGKHHFDEAIAACREAIRLKKDFAEAYHNLGNALRGKGQLDEAIAASREAIRLKKDHALAYCNLGFALKDLGQFRDAMAALEMGHKLGSQNSRWRHPSAAWLREVSQLVELDAKLPKVLKGETQPANVRERLQLASLCQNYKKLYATSAAWYAEAFAVEPRAAEDLMARHRYDAACAAALAGNGTGHDAGKLTELERTRLRQQALDWLRADLELWRQRAQAGKPQDRQVARTALGHWQRDTDLAAVRDAASLRKLSVQEQQAWRQLWADVAELLKRAAGND